MHNLKVRKHFLFQKIAATKQIWCEGLVEWQKKDVMFICFYFIVAFQKKKTEILTNSVEPCVWARAIPIIPANAF